jgi:hypothetical protein
VATHNLNGLFFRATASKRCLLDLSVELLIFPDFEPFYHKLFEQPNRITPSLARSFFKAFP